MSRYVVCAALKLDDDIIVGPRHFDETMRRQIGLFFRNEGNDRNWALAQQGFIDQHGRFMTREEAWLVATEARQLRRPLSTEGRALQRAPLLSRPTVPGVSRKNKLGEK